MAIFDLKLCNGSLLSSEWDHSTYIHIQTTSSGCFGKNVHFVSGYLLFLGEIGNWKDAASILTIIFSSRFPQLLIVYLEDANLSANSFQLKLKSAKPQYKS